MAPWSSRLLSPSSRNEPGSSTAVAGPVSPARTRAPSRITEADILENAYGIPSLPPPSHGAQGSSGSSRPTRTASHGRSMSHPFPSLFAGRKKRSGESATAGFESSDDDAVSPVLTRHTPQYPNTKPVKVPDKDLITGKCMTCDSMIRWPKELKVFRCTVCLTINDLKPIFLEARRGDGQRAPVAVKAGTYSGSSYVQRGTYKYCIVHYRWCNADVDIVAPLSLEKTRQVIDQCITAYLLDRLKHDDGSTSSLTPSPPHSPTVADNESSKGVEGDIGYTKESSSVQSSSQTPPIHLSGRPIDQGCQRGNKFPHEISRANSVPYSTSSPGSLFGGHTEEQDVFNSIRSNSSKGDESSRPGQWGNQHSKEQEDPAQRKRTAAIKNLFKPLEEYIIASFGSFECINTSFSTLRRGPPPRIASEGFKRTDVIQQSGRHTRTEEFMSEMDAKTLLLGDFAENGSWWTGGRTDARGAERSRAHRKDGEAANDNPEIVALKSPRIDWADVNEWYHLVLNAGRSWRRKIDELTVSELYISRLHRPSDPEIDEIEDQFVEAQSHAQRVLLKATESLLKRPGRPLNEPDDIRFLLIVLANPLLYPSYAAVKSKERSRSRSRSRSRDRRTPFKLGGLEIARRSVQSPSPNAGKGSTGQHSGIIKRILGLLSNLPNECHHHLVSWFSRYSDGHFQRTVDLIGSFVTYRLSRQHGKKREVSQDPTGGLIPNISGSGRSTSAALHDALGQGGRSSKKSEGKSQPVIYNDDWQIKAAARVMALLFSANNSGLTRRGDTRPLGVLETGHSAGLAARERAHNHGQILATSDFYNTLLDYSDLIADFEAWESRRGKFAFCQYPFFLSIWAKIQIMEHDARRQMEVKAREAFFDSIMTRKSVNQYLVLRIRRDCLVEDSLKGVSEVVGTGGEEIKKGLRIEFKGEEGIDAGGLRKEWFLLLVRDVFNPEHGMQPLSILHAHY
jgi:E3 ubiquitin-protein ligase HECTD2